MQEYKMPSFTRITLLGLAIGVMANALLIIYSHIVDTFVPHPVLLRPRSSANECCVELCNSIREAEQYRPPKILNYSEIANEVPHLDPSYHDVMVKLGTDLDFELSNCPAGSYMHSRTSHSPPKHLNCPTLFLVGARKGGTSSLYQYVSKHPDFEGTRLDAGPKAGETFYFSKFYNMRSWKSYLSLFPRGGVMTGDSSVGNLVHNLAPRRLFQACGKQAKVVMLLRDPIKRLESNFLMRSRLHKVRIGNQTSISTILKMELDQYFQQVLKKTLNVERLPAEWSKLVGLFHPAQNMVYEGLYYVHLMNWLCNFPAENILIINSEKFFENPSKILDIVFQFLGLKRLDSETYQWITSATYNKRSNEIPSYQKLTRTDIMNMLGVYKPFNKVLFDLLQWDSHKWLMHPV
jgi:[heparan sulfate]-glucosamine 3-sulfotransferase 2